MLKKVTTILHGIDELDTNAKSVAIGALEDSAYNVSHDWWEQPVLRCEEALGLVGFSNTTVRFALTAGAIFTGDFDSSSADYVTLSEKYPEVLSSLKNIASPINQDVGCVLAKVRRIRGTHLEKDAVAVCDVEFTDNLEHDVVAIQHELDNFNPDEWESDEHGEAAKELMQSRIETTIGMKASIANYITQVKDTMCDFIYKELNTEFDYLCSEDAIIETMRCEQMLFLVDGTRAPDFLEQDAVDVLEFEDVLADGSIEGHGYQCAEDENYVYTVADVSDFDIDSKGFEVSITVIDGEFITNKLFDTEADAKNWAAKYSLGER